MKKQKLKLYELPIRENIIDLYATVPVTKEKPIKIGFFVMVDTSESGIIIASPETCSDIDFLNRHNAEHIVITTNPDHNLPFFELVFLNQYDVLGGDLEGYVNLKDIDGDLFLQININGTVPVHIQKTSFEDIIYKIQHGELSFEEALKECKKLQQ